MIADRRKCSWKTETIGDEAEGQVFKNNQNNMQPSGT
jgi:hypothetical protein